MSFEIGLHENQMKVFLANARFTLLNCGRRFGKSWFGATKVIVEALKKPGGIYWITAPTYPQTEIMWRMVLKLLPEKYIKHIYLTKMCIELKNGATIWAKSTDKYDNLRGEGLDGVVLDEAAMMHQDAWFKIIRPALMDKMGWALFCTTPKGKNWYYRLFQKGVKGSSVYRKGWTSFTFSSYDNPYLDRGELQDIIEDLSEIDYEQEILAVFLSDGGAVFKNLDACTRSNISSVFVPGRAYSMGVDLGKAHDFTVIKVCDVHSKEQVYTERFNKTSWAYVVARIKEVYLRYGKPAVWLDATGVGDAVQEELERQDIIVMPYKFTTESKRQLVNKLAIAFANCEIFIPEEDRVLREELESFTYTQMESGVLKYGAPRGMYDDCVCALMLVNYSINGGIALCIGAYETEITENELSSVEKQLIAVNNEDTGMCYDWNADSDRFTDDDEPDEYEEMYEEVFETPGKKRRVNYITF